MRVRDGGLARELLLEVSTETGWEAVGRRIPKAGRHAHRASAKRGYKTQAACVCTQTHKQTNIQMHTHTGTHAHIYEEE